MAKASSEPAAAVRSAAADTQAKQAVAPLNDTAKFEAAEYLVEQCGGLEEAIAFLNRVARLAGVKAAG